MSIFWCTWKVNMKVTLLNALSWLIFVSAPARQIFCKYVILRVVRYYTQILQDRYMVVIKLYLILIKVIKNTVHLVFQRSLILTQTLMDAKFRTILYLYQRIRGFQNKELQSFFFTSWIFRAWKAEERFGTETEEIIPWCG
jgi:hypothetical protein